LNDSTRVIRRRGDLAAGDDWAAMAGRAPVESASAARIKSRRFQFEFAITSKV
jgi:hypothetical protein